MTARLSPRRSVLALALAACGASCGLDLSGTGDLAATTTAPPHPSSGGGPVKAIDSGASGSKTEGGSVLPPPASDDASVGDLVEDAGDQDVHLLDPDASYEEAGDPCDLDEDGYRATGACGGNDCCDFDSRAHPGDTAYYATKDACGSFDYDCNGQEQQEFPQAASCQLGFFTCNGSGFDKTPPACGVAGTFDTCPFDVLFCGSDQKSEVQACR